MPVNPHITKKRARFLAKEILFGFFYAFDFICILALIAFSYLFFFATPDAKEMLTNPPAKTSVIYDRTGEHVLYEIHGEENRKIITHEEIPGYMRLATITAEDASFYGHYGFDITSIIRALKTNISENERAQGGSTITQQLARNVFLTRKKTIERKILELVMAVKLERKFTKDEILDAYLNRVPYGSNTYGIESASETYFGKKANELTLDEAAILAALPKATTFYSPYGNNRLALVDRQQMILQKIKGLNLLPAGEVENALMQDTLKKIIPFKEEVDAPHFVFYVKEKLEEKYGKDLLETGGLKIYTTLDYDLQKKAEESVKNGVQKNAAYGAENAALVALDPKTGNVLAMVGSRDFFDTKIDGQVNVATSLRQPGSSFKPFAYARAFEKGFQPETLFYDVETNFGPDGSGKDYIPNNYDGKSHGLVSMRQALSMSLNIPAVKTLYLAGVDDTITLAERLGITTLKDRKRYGLSLVLGGGEVKLVDMVSAFSTFPNEGKHYPLNVIAKIEDDKNAILEAEKPKATEALDPTVAKKINSILSDNSARAPIFGSHSPLAFEGSTVAAKTGTTQGWRDAWTVGYNTSIVVGVWAGNNDSRLMKQGADGIYVAAPIWRDFINKALPRFPSSTFSSYEKVASDKFMITGNLEQETAYYDKKTGERISEEKAKDKKKKGVKKKKGPALHDILYYVNPDDPLGSASPNFHDPMVSRWEQALGKNFENSFIAPPEKD